MFHAVNSKTVQGFTQCSDKPNETKVMPLIYALSNFGDSKHEPTWSFTYAFTSRITSKAHNRTTITMPLTSIMLLFLKKGYCPTLYKPFPYMAVLAWRTGNYEEGTLVSGLDGSQKRLKSHSECYQYLVQSKMQIQLYCWGQHPSHASPVLFLWY